MTSSPPPSSAGHDVVALARRDLDIADADAVRAAVADARPDAVVNCAAWTDVDGAEEHEDDATRINGTGAGNLAAAAPVRCVHVSSDYVFDGDATAPYVEADPTGPRGAYGRSKLAGEHRRGRGRRPRDRALRLAVRAAGKNFVATMLKLAEDRDEVNVVADQIGCPTYTGHLAPALVDDRRGARSRGILHVAGGGQCSWHELAQATFEEAGTGTFANPVTTAEFPRPAPRPGLVRAALHPARRARASATGATASTSYLNSEVLQ